MDTHSHPDGNLYDIVEDLQNGDASAGWKFSEHRKIQAIIRGRLNDYSRQFHWLPREDLEDIQHGLRPRLIEIAARFKLPEQRNEGRIVSYFRLRIKGEADYLLKRITGMRQVTDKDGNLYLKTFNQPLDGIEDTISSDEQVDTEVIDGIEDVRQSIVLQDLLSKIKQSSNDEIWLKCYMLRLQGNTWAEVAKAIGYTQTDFAWLKDNTTRFVSRVKHRLIEMGEDINCRICGIYTDENDVAICVIDTVDPKNFTIWSKQYESYQDLDKVEAKLGDLFRQFDITYVVMNEVQNENRAMVICMRYLTKREAYVEFVDSLPFFKFMHEKPSLIRGLHVDTFQHRAYLLAEIKRAHIECIKQRANKD